MSTAGTVNGTTVAFPDKNDTGYAASLKTLLQALAGATSAWIQMGAASGLSAGNARYLAPGNGAASATEIFLIAPKSGKLSALQAICTALVGDSCVIVVNIDGVASSLTCTIAAAGTTASDSAHTVNVTAGQKISIKATAGSLYSSGGANLQCTVAFTPS